MALPGCCDCVAGLSSVLFPARRAESTVDDEHYSDLLGFLAEVPLFKRQLSTADLPDIANAMQRHAFRPGQAVVKQGQLVNALFLVKSGRALVMRHSDSRQDIVSAELVMGDYFGAWALVGHRPMPATVCAAGPTDLVVLTLSKVDFEAIGLHKRMTFPRRPALMGDQMSSTLGSPAVDEGEELDAAVVDFAGKAINANANLRILLAGSAQDVRALASFARRRALEDGEAVCRAGELAAEFVIVAEGRLQGLRPEEDGRPMGRRRSAETTLRSQVRLARRLKVKADIFGHLSARAGFKVGRTTSATFGQRDTSGGHPRRNTMSAATPRFKVGEHVHIVESPHVAMKKLSALISSVQQPSWSAAAREDAAGEALSTSTAGSFERQTSQPCNDGVVIDVGEGDVTVFAGGHMHKVPPTELRRVSMPSSSRGVELDGGHMVEATAGDTLGELSILYNARMAETYTAVGPASVYAIPRQAFRAFFRDVHGGHTEQELREWMALLGEVRCLSRLVHQHHEELARNATGRVSFEPGEAAMMQGASVEAPLWYVIEKGDCVLEQETLGEDGTRQRDSWRLHRGQHFGETAILRGDSEHDVSVCAGPRGMTCLAIDGFLLRELPLTEEDMPTAESSPERRRRWAARELELADLDAVSLLGRGAFGTVLLVRDRVSQDTYALKKMSIGKLISQNMQRRIVSEREILACMDSPFVMYFYKSFRDAQHIYLLLEVAFAGDLLQARHEHRALFECASEFAHAFYSGCAALALEHLHSRRIVFRDMKPENLILSAGGYAKLCDFGFARFCFGKTHTFLGTPDYMAPELIDPPHRHDHMVDWWALGVLLFELFTSDCPFFTEGDEDLDMYSRMVEVRDAQARGLTKAMLPRRSTSHAQDVMRGLLHLHPERRLCSNRGAVELLEHKWFACVQVDVASLRAQTTPPPFRPDVEQLPGQETWRKRPDAIDPQDPAFLEYKGGGDETWLDKV